MQCESATSTSDADFNEYSEVNINREALKQNVKKNETLCKFLASVVRQTARRTDGQNDRETLLSV